MTRVLHIINGDLYAGAERVQDLLALNLPRYGYDVGLLTLKDGLFASSRRATAAPLYTAHMRHRLDLGIARRVAAIVEDHGYEIVHTHSPRGALAGALATRISRVPLVHHVHGPTLQDTEYPWRNRRNALVERLSIGGAAQVISVSHFAAQYARALGVPPACSHVVWNGVDPAYPRTGASEAEVVTLGSVALFRPRKGVEVLIEAIALLAHVSPAKFRLLMVGGFETREYESRIRSLAASLGVADLIEWTGFTTDVDAMLRRMDVFVLPSLYGEGLPMVVLEAMAHGLPVVAAAVGGVAEAIRHREHGLLVTPGDATALRDGLRELVDEPALRRSLGEWARVRQVEHFSADAMAAGVAAVYARCARRSSAWTSPNGSTCTSGSERSHPMNRSSASSLRSSHSIHG